MSLFDNIYKYFLKHSLVHTVQNIEHLLIFHFFSFVFGGDGFLPDPPGQKHKVDGLCKCPKSDNINVIEYIIHQYPHYRQKTHTIPKCEQIIFSRI